MVWIARVEHTLHKPHTLHFVHTPVVPVLVGDQKPAR